MAVNLIHGIYLELERAAKARGDKQAAAKYRRAININRAANQVRRRHGERSALIHPHQHRLPVEPQRPERAG